MWLFMSEREVGLPVGLMCAEFKVWACFNLSGC